MNPGDPGHPKARSGRVDGSEAAAERRLVRDGMQVIAHGALVCPECALPIAIGGGLPVATTLKCGFCDHAGPVRAFLVEDVYDTVGNEAQLVARLRRAGPGLE